MTLRDIISNSDRRAVSSAFGIIFAETRIAQMVYQVTIEETYRYTRSIECDDQNALSEILHDQVPLIADMSKDEVEEIRQQGLELHCDFSW